MWRGSRVEPQALHAPLSRKLEPLAPGSFRGLRATVSRGFFRRWKRRFAWGLVALSSSKLFGLLFSLWHSKEMNVLGTGTCVNR